MTNRDNEYKVYNKKTGRRITSIRTQYNLKDAKILAREYAKEKRISLKNLFIKRFS